MPPVTALNQLCSPLLPHTQNDLCYGPDTTTSCHYAVVESEHPYKPATISHYKVKKKKLDRVSLQTAYLNLIRMSSDVIF